MPRYLSWTGNEIGGLDQSGLIRILTEVSDNGTVIRELGFDEMGNVIHRFSGPHSRCEYGLFDLATIAPSDDSDMSADEFDRLWLV